MITATLVNICWRQFFNGCTVFHYTICTIFYLSFKYTLTHPYSGYWDCVQSFTMKDPRKGSSLPIWRCLESYSDTSFLSKALRRRQQVYNLEHTQNRCWPKSDLRSSQSGITTSSLTHLFLPAPESSISFFLLSCTTLPFPCCTFWLCMCGGETSQTLHNPPLVFQKHMSLWQLNSWYCRNRVQFYVQS